MVLDPPAFEEAMRGNGGIDQRARMPLSAYEHQTGMVLRQQAVPKETNEQKAALALLKQLVLTGRVMTADALHCQQETCQLITDSCGHDVIPVKDNQPTLLAAIASEFTTQDAAFSPLPTTTTAG